MCTIFTFVVVTQCSLYCFTTLTVCVDQTVTGKDHGCETIDVQNK